MLCLDNYFYATIQEDMMHGYESYVSNPMNGYNSNNNNNGITQINKPSKPKETFVDYNGYNHSRSSSNSTNGEDEFGQRAIRKATYKRSSSEGAPKIPIDLQKTKTVRFADCLGLDLVDVREFCKSPPILRRIPSISDYCKTNEDFDSKFRCRFEQPSCQSNFYEKLHAQNVVLENISSEDEQLIVGFILCVNLAYKKNVGIRVTTNNWKTWEDITAKFYQDTRPSQFTDRFIFKIDPSSFKNGRKVINLEFAVWYKVNGMEFWDSNTSQNYIIEIEF